MKKQYVILVIMLLVLITGIWFFFFKSSDSNTNTNIPKRNLEELREKGSNNSENQVNQNINDKTVEPDGIRDNDEIIIRKHKNVINYLINERIPNIKKYTISSSQDEVEVSVGKIKVLRPYDVIKMRRKETKTGDVILAAVVGKNQQDVTISANSSAVAIILATMSQKVKSANPNIIFKIKQNKNTQKLASLISENLQKNPAVSPLDVDKYPEISRLIDLVIKEIK